MKSWQVQAAILTLLILACLAVWLGIATYQMTQSVDSIFDDIQATLTPES